MRAEYSLPDLQQALDHYPDIGQIRIAKLFTSGFENSNYYIETDSGTFALKIFEGLDIAPENVLFEIEIMDALYGVGTKTPRIFRTRENELYTKMGQKYVILMSFIQGENMEKRTISDSIAREIGEQTGKMDAALQKYRDGSKTRQNYEFDLKHLLALESKILELGDQFDKAVISDIFESFRAIKPTFDLLPSGLIHNDIVLHNILAEEDKLTGIIDFSDMVFSPYAQNVAVALTQCFFTYNWQPHQAGIFLKAYTVENSLVAEELSLLRTLVMARFAMLVLEFNHWNVIYGDDQQRTEFIHDNYQFLLKFNEISEDQFQAFLQ